MERKQSEPDMNTEKRKVTAADYRKKAKPLLKKSSTGKIRVTNVQIEDVVSFGSYPQSTEKKEPIQWIVMDIRGSKALLLSKQGLEALPYHSTKESITWQSSDIRMWLNGEFWNDAFDSEEKRYILQTTIHNPDNPVKHTPGGERTDDRVFLLSLEEAKELFADNEAGSSSATARAMKRVWTFGIYRAPDDRKAVWWWLRSPGAFSDIASYVRDDGGLNTLGHGVITEDVCVRPALFVNLDS